MLVIDVSNVNGSIDWKAVARQHVAGAFLKATEGHTFVDSRFAGHRRAARAAGIHVGAYHFARPDHNSPEAEAANFVRVVGKVLPGELRPVLDLEEGPGTGAWVRRFNAVIREKLGICPLLYSYPAFLSGMHLDRTVSCGLWLASYSRNDGAEHPFTIPAPWRTVKAHQFTSRARIAGVPGFVDLSHIDSLNAVLAHPVRARVWSTAQRLRRWLPLANLV